MSHLTISQACVAAARPDPRIGVLARCGRPVFYASIGGQFPERPSPEEVASLLADIALVKPARVIAGREDRCYSVTCTPKFPAFGEKPIVLTIWARDRTEAISKARSEITNAGHTRQDGPIVYVARRA